MNTLTTRLAALSAGVMIVGVLAWEGLGWML